MDERDEVVTGFDQTNGKAPGLEGDGRAEEVHEGEDDDVVLPGFRPLIDGTSEERGRD